MPVKKTVTETVEEQGTEPEIVLTDDELAEEAEESALDGLLAEFQGADNVSVNVYRQGDGKNMSFLFKTSPEEMTGGDIMERCRDKFGTGDYRMHVRQGRRIVSNRPFSVEAPKAPTVETVHQNSNADIIAVIQSQNQQMALLFQSTMAAMAEAFKGSQNQQPAVDPVAMQASVIQGLAAMKEIAGGDKKEPGAVEMLIKGIELSQSLAPKTGETNTMDILAKGLDMFPLLAKAGEPKSPMIPGQGHTNPPVGLPGHEPVHALKGPPQQPITEQPNPAPENAPKQTEEENAMFLAQAKANLAFLCAQAQNNRDPELYAELILDQMGAEKVLEFIGHDDALDQLAKLEPGVNIYKGWFLALKDAILVLTAPEQESEPVSNDKELPDDETVVSRIDASGLRREGRQGATVLIPRESGPTPGSEPERDGGDPTGDTQRSGGSTPDA